MKLKKSYFEVMGLCCSSEVPLIEGLLKPLDGVKEISVVIPSKTLIVVHDILTISPSQIGIYVSLAMLLDLTQSKVSCVTRCQCVMSHDTSIL